MPPVPLGPKIGLIVQVALLAALAASTGLSAVGWVTWLAYGLTQCVLLTRALTAGNAAFGPADWVTLTRAILVGWVTALTAESFTRPVPVRVLVLIAAVALVLDAVDGQVARRTGTASDFGARFDMEVDAFLILVLSVYVARSAGVWVLAIGALRYAYVAAGWAVHWMRATLPPRFWRKVVAATQGVVLAVVAAHVLPAPLSAAALAAALALLVESFGRDILWLYRAEGDRVARGQLGVGVDVAG